MKPSKATAKLFLDDYADRARARRKRRELEPDDLYRGLAGYGSWVPDGAAPGGLGYAEAQYQGFVRGEYEPDNTDGFFSSVASGWDPLGPTRAARTAKIEEWLDAHPERRVQKRPVKQFRLWGGA